MTRLPKGYIVASKRHASNSYKPFKGDDEDSTKPAPERRGYKSRKARERTPKSADVQGDSAAAQQPRAQNGQIWTEQRGWADIESSAPNQTMIPPTDDYDKSPWGLPRTASNVEDDLDDLDQQYTQGFGDSPGELAEARMDRVQLLRNLLRRMRSDGGDPRPNASHSLAERAWEMYDSLGDEAKDDDRLRQEMMQWMAEQKGDAAASYCQEMFAAMSKSSRTMEVYKAIILLYARRKDHMAVSELHQEALENLENGYLISRQLFETAMQEDDWQLALDTAMQHNKTFTERHQENQVRLFWLYVSDLPELMTKAIEFARHVGLDQGLKVADAPTREFCFQFFKDAITQEFMHPPKGPRLPVNEADFSHPPRVSIRSMFRHVIDMDPQVTDFLEQVLLAGAGPESNVLYRRYHHVFSYVYQKYRELSGVQPSEQMLSVHLQRVTAFWSSQDVSYRTIISLDIQLVLMDWKQFYGKVSVEAVHSLLSYYARTGQQKELDDMLQYQDDAHPTYEAQRDALWTRIYIHAQRDELDLAQQAFASVARLTGEHGDQPDLRCWNVLLLAHSHVDDLEGALTNFQNLLDHAKLQPDIDSFRPLFAMLSRRGEVAALEDLLEQYDGMVGESRSADMMLSLMTAHFRDNENVANAEAVLRKTVTLKAQGDVVGSLTPCFNALMNFYAVRRDLNATTRVYRWMRQEKVVLDGETFGALMQTLLFHRQAGPVFRILYTVMPEHHVPPTVYHYALMMAGFNHNRQYQNVIHLHQRMINRNIKPSIDTQVNYLKAKAHLERRERREADSNAPENEDPEAEPVALEGTLSELRRLIAQQYRVDTTSTPETPVFGRLEREDPITPYFDFLIYMHGARRCFAAVKQLMKECTELSKAAGRNEQLPINMLTALMSAHWHAGEHDKVEEYWKLALEQARNIVRPIKVPRFTQRKETANRTPDPLDLRPLQVDEDGDVDAPASQAGEQPNQTLLTKKAEFKPKPIPGRRDILDQPLRWYIKALVSQARVGEAIKLVSQLVSQGWFIGRTTWNLLIRRLLRTDPPLTLLAFVLTERFMMPHFPGWKENTYWPPRSANRANDTRQMRARYIGRTELMPEYRTLAQLGDAMLYLRRLELTGEREQYKKLPKELRKFVGTVADLRVRARETVYAVQSMPPLPTTERM